VLSQAVAPGRTIAAKAVEKSARRLRRSQKAAGHARRGMAHDNALHQVRKDAKRLRHVAESAGLVRGKRARKVAQAAHRQQRVLGDFHDALIARNLLQTLEVGRVLPETTTEALAALRIRQAELMAAAEAKYRKARKKSRGLLKPRVI
jgi:CHAD domain-containing protein